MKLRRYENDPAYQKAIRKVYRMDNSQRAVLETLLSDVGENAQAKEMARHITQARLGLSEKEGKDRLAFEDKRFKQTQALREKEFQSNVGMKERGMTQDFQQNLQSMQFSSDLASRGRQFQYGQDQQAMEYGKSGMNTANWINLGGVGVSALTGYAKMNQDVELANLLRRKYGV